MDVDRALAIQLNIADYRIIRRISKPKYFYYSRVWENQVYWIPYCWIEAIG